MKVEVTNVAAARRNPTVDDIPAGEAFRYRGRLYIRIKRGPRHKMLEKYRRDPACHRSVLIPETGHLDTLPWNTEVTPVDTTLQVAQ